MNAGQTPPLLLRRRRRCERLSTGGIALAMFEESTYDSGHTRLDPGDALVMYSDGITEAEVPTARCSRIRDWKRRCGPRPAWPRRGVLGRAVFAAVDHTAGERLADDLTVLVLSRPMCRPSRTAGSTGRRKSVVAMGLRPGT